MKRKAIEEKDNKTIKKHNRSRRKEDKYKDDDKIIFE